ncbi:hypothetical protein [Cellulomonas alba]|uniref:DUF4190 domain-containing protein n=1 Tax=Cellulomonas alba TaxID=3053467 RepID=A0ABT7SDG0_9CELL|nr:hypothetical protein [Cellulomonas alba]MDM7854231.1 hypothetical protein [Cellulomonas alba]
MSNPYAPPEDRPRPPQGEPAGGGAGDAQAPVGPDGRPLPDGAPDPRGLPVAPPAHAPRPEGPPAWGAAHGARPGDPGGAGAAGPGPGAPDAAATARVTRLAGTFGMLVVASLLVGTLRLPWRLAAIGFGVLAIVWGVRALTTAARSGFRGGLPVMLGIGVLVAGGWVLLNLVSLVSWDALRANQECSAQALTQTAHQECEQQFRQDQQKQFKRP